MKQAAGTILTSIHLDRSLKKGIVVQLYLALRDLILSGHLRPKERLPATRVLSRELNVSRTTVIEAMDRLIAEGMLISRVGAGTFVSDAATAAPAASMDPLDVGPKPRLAYSLNHANKVYARRSWLPHRMGSFVTALPALDAFPMAHWARITARHLRCDRSLVMGYGEPKGLLALRQAIAAHLNALKGIQCNADQIFITTGAQHGFSLIGKLFLNPGDRVWMENPGASGARNALLSEGAHIVPVPVDNQGIIVSEGLSRAPHFRLAFVTPSHQQPLGHVMSLQRRLELLKAADDAQALIIEDDYDGEFHYGSAPQPALRGIDRSGRVLYVGTFSKTLFPSLRLGFLLVPERMTSTFDHAFQTWVSGPSTFVQASVADFMDEGYFAAHIRLMRRLYKARYHALMEAAATLPDTITMQETGSGFHTCAYLAPGVDPASVVAQAAERGVILAALDRYCLEPMDRKGLVFGFGSATPEQIRSAMEELRTLPALRKLV